MTLLIWEPGWYLTYNYWPTAVDKHIFEEGGVDGVGVVDRGGAEPGEAFGPASLGRFGEVGQGATFRP
ncbi:hypothetical protein, partial [Rhodococcus chondri]